MLKTTFKCHGEDDEEEDSDGAEVVLALVGGSEGTGGKHLAQSNQPDPSLLAIMQQMTQSMAKLQDSSSSEAYGPLSCNTPSIKAPACFDGT
ncbi:hypothetical protein O181_122072 [Austropuccinia psidii MF-1]|uniref:Uncharacterized protein n=1 Tax=Austropuccinia psidii MF-1 TaxID=1389203 RepID=A0A9Q3KK46_9BASI|nr:hypothetical protein [Austropuccinia psidii MF-1]